MNIIHLLVEVDELRLAIIQAITCCVAFRSHIHHSEPQSWWLLRMLDDYIGEYMVSIIHINIGIKRTYMWLSKFVTPIKH